MTAAPLPADPPPPATAEDLGHKIRYPVSIVELDGRKTWRSGCHCHYWLLLDPLEAEAAIQ